MRLHSAVLLLVVGCGSPHTLKDTRPNFVVIMADDLGYGDLSTYGGWIAAPSLERMASEGLRFTDFHSNGAVCSPTRAALMTGRYQQRAGLPIVVYAPDDRPTHIDGLQDVEHTFAEMLQDSGYKTGIFGKWHLGYYVQYNPVHHGFGEFRGYVSGNIDFFSHVDGAGRLDWWQGADLADESGYVTSLINRDAVGFIEDNRDRLFCLYVAHEAPHFPYQGPDDDPTGFRVAGGFSGRQDLTDMEIRSRYREMVLEMDTGVGEILDTLGRLGLAERTLVLFFSDNGATRDGSNGSLRGFKGSVWEGGHRVPALAWWPGVVAAGSETAELAATFDIWPTLADLAGVGMPLDRPLDGVSLVPVLHGGEVPRGPMFWSYMDGLAMRDGNWKIVVGEHGDSVPRLFDLESDLEEAMDLSESEPQRAAEMSRRASDWLQRVSANATPQPSGSL